MNFRAKLKLIGGSHHVLIPKPIAKLMRLEEDETVTVDLTKYVPVFVNIFLSFKEKNKQVELSLVNEKKLIGFVNNVTQDSVTLYDKRADTSHEVPFCMIAEIDILDSNNLLSVHGAVADSTATHILENTKRRDKEWIKQIK